MLTSVGSRRRLARRNASPSPLLLCAKAMELAIIKERMRCDRHGHWFSLIVIELGQNKAGENQRTQARRLAKLVHKRLRLTDEKGILRKGGLGLLLPMTDLHGARKVKDWLLEITSEHDLAVEAEVFHYDGREDTLDVGFDLEKPIDNAAGAEPEGQDASDVSRDSTHSKSKPISFSTSGLVRADDRSQVRLTNLNQLTQNSTVTTKDFCPRYPKWKRATDIAGALIGLTFATPVIAIAAIAIKLNSKGPVFFRQMRTGQYGNAFPIYKLRTMVIDAEELKSKLQELNERDGPAFKIKNDPRVTSVGKFLRATGIDELPQLWNILIGNMAIVGPRPLPCSEDAKCKVWQRRRLDTKPGLTCTWQISKSREIPFDEWMRMDLNYSRRNSILSDISLVFQTVMAVVKGKVGH
jgi:lipopolysaccharide/colanic/teichoic acid biosynthesis glycosyltransferase